MLETKRMSALDAYDATNIISTINSLEPNLIKNAIQEYRERFLNCFYDQLEFALFVTNKDLSKFITNPEFNDYFDPTSKVNVLNHGYLGTLSFPVTILEDKEVVCHLYCVKRDNFVVAELRVREDIINKDLSSIVMKAI